MKNIIFGLLLSIFLSACASNNSSPSVSKAELNQVHYVSYGRIMSTQVVNLQSTQATGAVIGGATGLATGAGHSTESKIYRSLGGALLGAGVETALTSGKTATQYVIRKENGQSIRVASMQQNMLVADCVMIEERAGEAEIQRVAASHCANVSNAVGTSVKSHSSTITGTDACEVARTRLHHANGMRNKRRAMQQVKEACGG